VRGTLILLAAGLFARILGFAYRVILARELGSQGMGLLSMVQPVIFFAVTLATAGLPVAISKIVAERAAVKPGRVREVLRTSLIFVILTSTFFTAVLLFAAPFVAHTFLIDPRSLHPLLSLVPLLAIVALSVVYRGYFQGLQNMTPGALAQGVEQVIRLGLILWLLPLFLRHGVTEGAVGAGLALVGGELSGLAVLFGCYLATSRSTSGPPVEEASFSTETLGEIMAISGPVTLTRIVASVTDLADAVIIPRRLVVAGFTTDAATAFYGNLYGMAMPLLFFPTVFTFALAQSLVPAVSEAMARGDVALVRRRTDQAIRLGILVALPTSAIFLLLGHSLGILFYGKAAVGDLIIPLSLAAPFLYLEVTASAVLRGLGRAALATVNGLVGSVVRLGVVYTLAADPRIGIAAVIVGVSIDLGLSFLLNLRSLVRIVGLRVDLAGWCLKPALAALPLVLLLKPVQSALLGAGHGLWFATASSLVIGLGAFLLSAFLVGMPLNPRSIA